MNSLYLRWHLGLGDAIICNGLVRVLARNYDRVYLPVKPHNEQTVKWMFSDINCWTVPVKDDAEMLAKGDVMLCRYGVYQTGIGLWSGRGLQQQWDKAFYEDARVPFEARWSEFKYPMNRYGFDAVTVPGTFLHEDRKRDYVIARSLITKLPIYEPLPPMAMVHHLDPLALAEEIHVIDSCFLALADSIETKATRLCLHSYATEKDPYKQNGPPTLRKNWEILK